MDEKFFNGKRFTRFGKYWRSSRRFLHRAVWELHRGPIPEGYHVHHKDGDRENNGLDNLELKRGRQHLSDHHKGHTRRPDAALAALPAWRASAEGQRHMSEMGRRNAVHLQTTGQFVCECCGVPFVAVRTGNNRFCSNACKAKSRRRSGVDKVDAVCPVCAAAFRTDRFRPSQCCSRGCGRRLWLATPAGREHLARLASRRRR